MNYSPGATQLLQRRLKILARRSSTLSGRGGKYTFLTSLLRKSPDELNPETEAAVISDPLSLHWTISCGICEDNASFPLLPENVDDLRARICTSSRRIYVRQNRYTSEEIQYRWDIYRAASGGHKEIYL
jgi:hypothetical protein